MTTPDPIQEMINQITNMVKLVQEKKFQFSNKPLPPGIDQMIDDLEAQVKMFCEITDETLKELGISKETIQERLNLPLKKIPPEERKPLRQLSHLKQEIGQIKWLLDKVAIASGKTAHKKDMKKRKGAKHRKRYKRMGGDEKWKAI